LFGRGIRVEEFDDDEDEDKEDEDEDDFRDEDSSASFSFLAASESINATDTGLLSSMGKALPSSVVFALSAAALSANYFYHPKRN
jgi:hypothetical protein